MKFMVDDRVFPQATNALIVAGLNSLTSLKDCGLIDTVLEGEDGSTLLTRIEIGGYSLQGSVFNVEQQKFWLYETTDGLIDLGTLTSLFISFLSGDDAWKSIISWKAGPFDGRPLNDRFIQAKAPDSVVYKAGPEYGGAEYYIDPFRIEHDQFMADAAKSIIESERKVAELVGGVGSGQPSCFRCGSTSISSNQKGYGAGKGLVGALIAGPIGLLGGFFGSGKVKVTCMNCGHSWTPGSIFR